jgi:hypothetical protein
LITPPSFWRASAQWPVCSGSSRRQWNRRMSGPSPRKACWPSFPRHLEKEFATCPSTPHRRTKTCTAMCMRSPARLFIDWFRFSFAFSLLACYCFVDGALRCLRAYYPMSVQGICRRYVRSVLLVVQRQSENNCRCGNLVSGCEVAACLLAERVGPLLLLRSRLASRGEGLVDRRCAERSQCNY